MPLKKEQKIGNFCFLCSVLGQTYKFIARLFELASDNCTRQWGPQLHKELWRGKTVSKSCWLMKDGGRTQAQGSGSVSLETISLRGVNVAMNSNYVIERKMSPLML